MKRRMWHTCEPEDLLALAREWFVGARRIELQTLARELGISRATAYRWAGNTEQLLGEVLASIVDETFQDLIRRSHRRTGHQRVVEVLTRGMRYAHAFAPLRQFMASHPKLGLKLAASKRGPVRARTAANLERLLKEEVERGHLALAVAPETMAHVLTRATEPFLYTDLVTGERLDLDHASAVIQLVLRGET